MACVGVQTRGSVGELHGSDRVALLAVAACVVLFGCTAPAAPPRDGGAALDGGAPLDGGVPVLRWSACVQDVLPSDGGLSASCFERARDGQLIDLGELRGGACRIAQVTVANTGDAPLVVEAPSLDPTGAALIQFVEPAPAGFTLAGRGADGGLSTTRFGLQYCATDNHESFRRVTLRSNDPAQPVSMITVRGAPIDWDLSPSCDCNPSTIETQPGVAVDLSGSRCGGGHGPLQYSWRVLRSPPGSTATITTPDGGRPFFVPDVPTTASTLYVVRLTASDVYAHTAHCDLTIFAPPPDGLRTRLVWSTHSDDVDLHLLRRAGVDDPFGPTGFFSAPNDCYYANRAPRWGDADGGPADPLLMVDDTNGYGPEELRLPEPAPGTYSVGAFFHCDDFPDGGPSNATVRIYCGGPLVRELGPKPLPGTGAFWHAADVTFPGCVVTPVDTLHHVDGGCGGF